MLKRSWFLLLTIIIMLSFISVGTFSVRAMFKGETSKVVSTTEFTHLTEVPEGYISISTKSDLDAIRNDLSGNYILMNDIEFSDNDFDENGQFYNEGNGWRPIGNSNMPFTGVFDGNGYRVIGYQIHLEFEFEYVGLWGCVSGSIENLLVSGIIDVSVSSSNVYVGGICGYLSGTIQNCQNNVNVYSSETVSSSTYEASKVNIGGIAGCSVGSINYCSNHGAISVSPHPIDYSELYGYVGGVVGYNDKGNLSNSENVGNVEVKDTVRKGTEKRSVYYLGGLSAYSTGKVVACNNSGSIATSNPANSVTYSYRYLAGISAYSNGEIDRCSNKGSVNCIGLFAYAGGIVANNDSYIVNCNNHGSILGTSQSNGSSNYKYTYVAGISGYSSGDIEKSYNTGDIQWAQLGASELVYTGGISGYTKGGISNCYNAGAVEGEMYYGTAGGIAGSSIGDISHCYDIGCAGNVSAIAGSAKQLLNGCFYSNYAKRGTKGKDVAISCSLEQLQKQSTYAGFDFETVWTFNENSEFSYPVLISNPHVIFSVESNSDFSGGRGTIIDPYIIKTTSELDNIRNYPFSHFVLGNDIIFDGGTNWTTIEEFWGSINGNGFDIINMKNYDKINGYSVSFIGLMSGYIFNLGMKNADIRSTSSVNWVGGFAGCLYGKIDNCYFSGNIYCSVDASVGGIAGDAAGPINNCYNVGNITCANNNAKTGGIAGYLSGGSGDAGSWDGCIESCYNAGSIKGMYAGGLVGESDEGEISNCYNIGSVSGTRGSGGILGLDFDNSYIYNCYNCGEICDSVAVGAICGLSFNKSGVSENCYYLDNVSSASSDGYITGEKLSSIDMSIKSTFRGFDFKTIWTMEYSECYVYPQLISTPYTSGHRYGAWKETKAPTCTATGTEEHECSVCHNKEIRTINAKGHKSSTAVEENREEATCIASGHYDSVIYCSVCNEELSREQKTINALGHNLTHHEAKAATCTAIGWEEYDTCSRCDYTTYKEIAAKGHTEVIDKAIAPTCTKTGLTEGKHCSVCNEVLVEQEIVNALGHELTHHEAKVVMCTEIGWEAYDTCSRCDYTTYKEIAAKGHTEVLDKAIAPTCTKTGLTEGKHCSECNEVFVEQKVVAATGHKYGEWIEDVAPTVNKEGNEYRLCERCGNREERSVPKLKNDSEAGCRGCNGSVGTSEESALFIVIGILLAVATKKRRN